MDKIDAIRKMREQVEAGLFDPSPKDARAPYYNRFCNLSEIALANGAVGLDHLAFQTYKGSLDAAKALHDALLPGKSWTVCPGGAGVDYSRHDYRAEADNDNPARAWLIAILRALEAQEGGE